jgi:hypothetical protein
MKNIHKSISFTLLFLVTHCFTTAQGVGVGTNMPNASAVLELNSTSRGLLPPRMTLAQRNMIASPAQTLMIYCTDCGSFGEMQYYTGIT